MLVPHRSIYRIPVPALAVLATILLLTACGGPAEEGAHEETAVRVQVATATGQEMVETVCGIGTLRAMQTVELRPETAGRITRIPFEEGDRVAEGDLLFELDTRKLERELRARSAALEAAEARLENAERELDRAERLYAQNVATEDRRDQAATEVRAARAEVRRLESEVSLVRERLADMRIEAPFEGMISEALVDPGDFVGVGDRLATLYRTDALEIEFSLPERHSGRVTTGQQAELRVSAWPDRSFSATTTFVSPGVNDDTRDFLVKARLANPDALLKPGTFATAVLTVDVREDALTIPEEALIATREGYMVFVVDDEDHARRRSVEIGLRDPGRVQITNGLEAGEQVVRTGHMRVADGSPLNITSLDRDDDG